MKRLIFISVFISISTTISHAEIINYGKFTDSIKVEWLRGIDNNRNMRLLNDVSYFDPNGKEWIAPKGYVTDGASIPKVFWSLVGGPFDDQYREAALIHDVYCDSKSQPWQDVHRVFYYANRAAGVSEFKSKVLYYAVRFGGPRWDEEAPSNCFSGCHATGSSQENIKVFTPTKEVQKSFAKAAMKWIEANNPSIEEIDEYIESTISEKS